MKRFGFIVFSSLFWISCSEEFVHEEEKEHVEFRAENVIHPLTFSESNLFNVSFPNWFDQHGLTEKGVDSIYLGVYLLDWITDSTFKKELDYTFAYKIAKDGQVKKTQFVDYYELAPILTVSFHYSSSVDSLGYSLPRVEKVKSLRVGKKGAQLFRTAADLQRFNRLELKELHSDSYSYVNTTSLGKEKHIFISDPKNQNILFVDKLETSEEDVFYYGTPTCFNKAFGLTDLVNEDVHAEFEFYANTCFPKTDQRKEQGLHVRGEYVYNPDGLWLARNDSIFNASGDFVKLISMEINRFDNGLPAEVRFMVGTTLEDRRANKIIEAKYAYRKEKAQ